MKNMKECGRYNCYCPHFEDVKMKLGRGSWHNELRSHYIAKNAGRGLYPRDSGG